MIKKQATPGRPGPSLYHRFINLARRNPGMLFTMLREGYRRKIGGFLDCRLLKVYGRSAPPSSLELNLTRRCNLKCVMCRQNLRAAAVPQGLSWYDPARELPLAGWVGLLDQVKYFRPRLYLTGGEPLIYPHFPEFLKEAKKRGFMVQLQTNGTLLAKVADLLVDQGVEMVNVSIDGPEEVHDRIRTHRGALQLTLKGIRALTAARQKRGSPGPVLLINCVATKANLGFLDQIVPLALSLGADMLQIQNPMIDTPANVARHNARLSPEFARDQGLEVIFPSILEGEYYQNELAPEDLPRLAAALKRVKQQAKGRINLMIWPEFSLDLLAPYYQDLDYPFPQVCNALWTTGIIFPDGTVSPCLHVVAGNIAAQPFKDIWNGPRMRRFRELIGQGLLPGCARCCHRSFIGKLKSVS